MTNQEEQAIRTITGDLRPVRPLPGIPILLAEWLIVLCAMLGAVVWWLGTEGFAGLSPGKRIAFGAVLLAEIAVLAYGMVTSQIPGSLVKMPILPVALALALIFVGEVLFLFHESYPFDLRPIHQGCFLKGLAAASFVGLAVALQQRRGFAADRSKSIMIGFATAAAVALAALTIYCPIQAWSHVMISHVAAVVLLLLVGAATAQLTR